jgi:hypothetical protein
MYYESMPSDTMSSDTMPSDTMPSDTMPIGTQNPKNKTKKTKKIWKCEKHNGCMWSCPCDCSNCIEFNKTVIHKK